MLRYFIKVNKTELFKMVLKALEANLSASVHAAQKTYEDATHEDAKAENKYDTRGLEASYLAGAQAKRAQELKDSLTILTLFKLPPKYKDARIALGRVVLLESEKKKLKIFLLPKGGGIKLQFEGAEIQVATPESPLGSALIGKSIEDTVIVNLTQYEITEVI
jgi:transcription elongation GreA/GreB family factor